MLFIKFFIYFSDTYQNKKFFRKKNDVSLTWFVSSEIFFFQIHNWGILKNKDKFWKIKWMMSNEFYFLVLLNLQVMFEENMKYFEKYQFDEYANVILIWFKIKLFCWLNESKLECFYHNRKLYLCSKFTWIKSFDKWNWKCVPKSQK